MKLAERLVVTMFLGSVGLIGYGFMTSYSIMRSTPRSVAGDSNAEIEARRDARNRRTGEAMTVAQAGFGLLILTAVGALSYAMLYDKLGKRREMREVVIDAKLLMVDGELVMGGEVVEGSRPYLRLIDLDGASHEVPATPGAYAFAREGATADIIIHGGRVIGITHREPGA